MEKRHSDLLFLGMLTLVGLYLSSLYNYLLFHSLAEMFSIIIACGIFMIAWNSREYFDNNYLLFIGIAYLFVGGLDLIHMLGYRGMEIFKGYDANLPTQLWIAARYMESLSLLIAFRFFRRRLRPSLVFLGYSAAFSFLLMSIFYWDIFPVCFVEGTGLTPFKKISEYIISFILLASIALLFKNRKEFDRTVLRWVIWSIVLTIVSEMAFTFYVQVYGLSNLIGHYLKILSFYFIYKGVIQTGLQKPYDVMFRKIKLSEERFHSLFTNMINGFAYHEVVFDEDREQPVDYVFLEVNDAFERLTGLKRENLIGKRVTEVIPGIRKDSADWIGKYGKVAMTGEAIRLENYSEALGRWYSVLAYSPERDHFVTVFEDVTDRRQAEKRLHEALDRATWLARFPEQNPNPIVRVSTDGTVLYCNPVAAKLRGWTCEVGQLLQNQLFQLISRVMAEGREVQQDVQLGERFYMIWIVPFPEERYANVYGRDITVRKQAEDDLKKAHDELEIRVKERTVDLEKANKTLRHLSSRLLSAQEEERKRIALEIHDTIGACLSAVKFKVQGTLAGIETKNQAEVAESFKALTPVIQEGIEECRRLQQDLRPSILDDLGLLVTLSWFCRRYQTIYTGIKVDLEQTLEESDIPNPLKVVIFRVTQEGMNNIAKHSKSDVVHMSLRKMDGRIELVLEDNGQGFDLKKVLGSEKTKQGLGLTSMRERTELSGGSFAIESAEGKGTVIRASWPLSEEG